MAYDLVRTDDITMAIALQRAAADSELRHLFFITPFQFELSKGGTKHLSDRDPKKTDNSKGQRQKQKADQSNP